MVDVLVETKPKGDLHRIIRRLLDIPVWNGGGDHKAPLIRSGSFIVTNRQRYPSLPDLTIHQWSREDNVFFSINGNDPQWSLYFRHSGDDIEVLRLVNFEAFKTAVCLIGLVR